MGTMDNGEAVETIDDLRKKVALTSTEAGRLLGVTKDDVVYLGLVGELGCVKIRDEFRWRPADLMTFVSGLRTLLVSKRTVHRGEHDTLGPGAEPLESRSEEEMEESITHDTRDTIADLRNKLALTASEVGRLLGITAQKVARMEDEGILRGISIGAEFRWRPNDVQRFVDQCPRIAEWSAVDQAEQDRAEKERDSQ